MLGVSAIAFGVFLSSAYLGGRIRILVGLLIYMLLAYYGWKNKQPIRYHLWLLAPFLIPIVTLVVGWPRTALSIPTILLPLLCYGLTWAFAPKRYGFALTVLCTLAFSAFYYTKGAKWYKHFVVHNRMKLHNGANTFKRIVFSTTDNEVVLSSTSSFDTLYVLDFWHTACQPCFDNFPEWSAVINRFEQSKEPIKFYAVALPFRNQNLDSILSSLKRADVRQNINPAVACYSDQLVEDLQLDVVPTTILVKGNEVLYKGAFVDAIKWLDVEYPKYTFTNQP